MAINIGISFLPLSCVSSLGERKLLKLNQKVLSNANLLIKYILMDIEKQFLSIIVPPLSLHPQPVFLVLPLKKCPLISPDRYENVHSLAALSLGILTSIAHEKQFVPILHDAAGILSPEQVLLQEL